jgi:hypothetical protein
MMHRAAWVTVGAVLLFARGPVCAETADVQVHLPATERIDILAPAASENTLSLCRLTGEVILWVSRRVDVVDEMGARLGAIEAGLAQFAAGSQLQGCVPDGAALQLSDRFANFLVAGEQSVPSGSAGHRDAAALASQLAQDFYHLAEQRGRIIPLVDGINVRALGSVRYRFHIVLIRNGSSGAMDAVIHRETTGTKFAPDLADTDRRLSRLKWSSVQ